MMILSSSAGLSADSATAAPDGTAVAVLPFENRTGDEDATHWGECLRALLEESLTAVPAVRVRRRVELAYDHLELPRTVCPDLTQAREIGDTLNARYVVMGGYGRRDGRWQVVARCVEATGGTSLEALEAESSDWFEIRNTLAAALLERFGLQPSETKPQKWTDSPEALESYAHALHLRWMHEPLKMQARLLREAIEADSGFVRAHVGLASRLGSQGMLEEGEESAREATRLDPGSGRAWTLLGFHLAHREKPDEARTALERAVRLSPREPGPRVLLGQVEMIRGELEAASALFREAIRLDPLCPEALAALGAVHAMKNERGEALMRLRQAARLGEHSVTALETLAQIHQGMGDIASAVEEFDRLLDEARRLGVNPAGLAAFESEREQLHSMLVPVFLSPPRPEVYTPQALDRELTARLSEEERELLVFPLESAAGMKDWALELSRGAYGEMAKVRALFDGLMQRDHGEGQGGTLTAREAFEVWDDEQVALSCQEYAKLFVVLARAVGLDAYYVHVERDHRNALVDHDCAGVFLRRGFLLVDLAYRWLGPPHREFLVLDDLQAIAHQLCQPSGDRRRDVKRARAGVKLHPDFPWVWQSLVAGLANARRFEEARGALETLKELEPLHWKASFLEGVIALQEGRQEEAERVFHKALAVEPAAARAWFGLGDAYARRGKQAEALEAYNRGLGIDSHSDTARAVLLRIAEFHTNLEEKGESRS